MAGSVIVQQVSKRFTRYERERPHTMKERMIQGFRPTRILGHTLALQDVTVEAKAGRMLGIVGQNGSGKSTLLRIVGGVMKPDVGSVTTTGRLSGLLELNTGMHPELTGRENILIGGVVAGLTRQQVLKRFDEIVAFSELEKFIDSPVRTYSTGMKMRLGFAVAINTEPDVLLIDEVLSVGDMAFQAKCLDRIRRVRDNGCAVILITHDLVQVEKLCQEALWLDRGRVVAHGTPSVLVGQYRSEMARKTREVTPADVPAALASSGRTLRINENRFGSLELQISEVRTESPPGINVEEITSGAPLRVRFAYKGEPSLVPAISISIGTADGTQLLDVNTLADGVVVPQTGAGQTVQIDLDRIDLAPGDYFVNVGLFQPGWEHAYDYHWAAYPLRIIDERHPPGALSPPRKWAVYDNVGGVQDGVRAQSERNG